MPRRTLEEQIQAAQTKKERSKNRLKELLQQQKEKDRTARTHRLCKRMGMLENMLPDIITLTDEQFEVFLKRTTANSFGRDILAGIVQSKPEKPIAVPQGKMPKRNGETAESQVEFADESGGEVSAQSAENATEGS